MVAYKAGTPVGRGGAAVLGLETPSNETRVLLEIVKPDVKSLNRRKLSNLTSTVSGSVAVVQKGRVLN